MRILVPIFVVMAVTLSGCGRSEPLVSVEGKVTIKGKPLEKGTIAFQPDAAKGNTSKLEPMATLNRDGSFRLQCGERGGAPLGWYKVMVVARDAGDSTRPPVWIANAKYANAKETPLTVEVVASPPKGGYQFHLDP